MLELREFTPREVDLAPTDLRALLALARGGRDSCVFRSVTPTGSGQYVVVPGPFVGRLRLPTGLVVDIRSRLALDDLATLLSAYAGAPSVLRTDIVPASEHESVVDLIAAAFVDEVGRLIGYGLPKGYVTRIFGRPPFPGRPDVALHLRRHAGRADRLVTRAQRLTLDVAANQVIAAAHDLLLRAPLRNPLTRARLTALAPALAAIARPAAAERLVPRTRPRLPRRSRAAFETAALVLVGTSVLPEGVDRSGATVLFPMTAVWEAFIERTVAMEAPDDHRVVRQVPLTVTDPPRGTRGSADVVEYGPDGRPIAVYDAKYKPLGSAPSTDDLYQIYTYCRRLNADRGVLLQPGRGERTTFSMGDVTVEHRGVPVLRPIDATSADMSHVAVMRAGDSNGRHLDGNPTS